jgi:hypothetical protein
MNKLLNPEEQKKMVSYGKPQGKNNKSPYKNGGPVKTLKKCACGC